VNGEPCRGVFDVDVDRSLEALRGTWGDGYAVCYDGTAGITRRWRAWRLGGGGTMLAGSTPDELGAAVRADWGVLNPWGAR